MVIWFSNCTELPQFSTALFMKCKRHWIMIEMNKFSFLMRKKNSCQQMKWKDDLGLSLCLNCVQHSIKTGCAMNINEEHGLDFVAFFFFKPFFSLIYSKCKFQYENYSNASKCPITHWKIKLIQLHSIFFFILFHLIIKVRKLWMRTLWRLNR